MESKSWTSASRGGQSAFTADLRQLPVLHQTLLDIEAGIANALVMHESSRLARNEQLANHLLDRLIECGAAFVNSTIDTDYATPEGRVFFGNGATMNAYVSRKTSQHAKKGKLEQFLKGLPVGRIPFGYESQVGSEGRTRRDLPPVQIPKEAALIHKAYQERALGRSPNEIARQWNALGFRPRSVRGVQQFGPQTVRAILENPFHMGYVRHHGEQNEGLHGPIVTEKEWFAAQRPKARITRRRLPPLLLQGIATCARCGRAVYPARPRKGPAHPAEHYSYYRESSSDSNRECADAHRMWSSKEPDAFVDELIRSLTMSQKWLDYVVAEAVKLPENLDVRRRGLEETRRRIQKEDFKRHLSDKEYGKLRQECDSELALLPSRRPDLDAAVTQFKSFGSMWAMASAEARNDTCQLIFEKVVLDMRNHTLEVCPTPEFEPLFQLRRSLYVSAIPPEPDSPLSADSETPIPRS